MINISIEPSDKCNGDVSLFVSFEYDTNIVNFIRSLPTRYWHTDSKEWEVPYNKLGDLVNQFRGYRIKITGELPRQSKEIEIPNNFDFKTKPFSHQIEGFKYGLNHTKWLLGDEQGLGKTKQVIDIAVAKKLKYGYKHCLIICGVNGLKWNWVDEVETHSNESAYIIGQRTKNGKTKIGSIPDRVDDLKNIDKINDYFLITNIESLRNDNIANLIEKYCKDGTIGLVAADEVHKMKNTASKQGKGFLKVNARNEIAMTGTPLMNTPLDLFMILKWLGYEKHNYYQFKSHYCVMGGYNNKEITGYKNLDELQERLDSIMLRRLKNEVLDLPPKTHINEYVEMTPKQEQIYREIRENILANIDQICMSKNPLSQLIRLRQATGYTGILSSTIKESAKLDRMEELVEDAIDNGKKVVIFSNWSQITDAVIERLNKKHGVLSITGSNSTEERQITKDLFQNNDNYKIIVGTIGAMGTGLTLTAGTVEIFMDEPWTKADKDQAEDRCHRVGTKENITIYTLLTKGTIDERIHDIVEQKGELSDLIVDGTSPIDRRSMFEYLIG